MAAEEPSAPVCLYTPPVVPTKVVYVALETFDERAGRWKVSCDLIRERSDNTQILRIQFYFFRPSARFVM